MRYGYARVSSIGQEKHGSSLFDQEETLVEAGAEIIIKEQFTGTTMNRPKLNGLIGKLQKGDTLIVTKLDRLARNAKGAIELTDELFERGVKIHILNMGIIENTTMGKLIRTLLAGFAEFERDTIAERTQTGKAMKRRFDPNWKEGRPKKEVPLFKEYYEKYLNGEISMRKSCKVLNISQGKWYSLVKENGL